MNHDESLSDLVGRVVDDAKAVAEAELAVAKVRVSIEARRYGIVGALFAGAAALAFAALLTLLVGLVLTLAPRVGVGLATMIVVIVTLSVAALLGLIGYTKVKSR